MLVPTINIDDSQLQRFLKESPRRANWALSEAIKAAGGHWRKVIIEFIKRGGNGMWPPLRPMTKKLKLDAGYDALEASKPLQFLKRIISFKFSRPKKTGPQVKIGIFLLRKTSRKEKLQTTYKKDSRGNSVGHKYSTKAKASQYQYFKKYFKMTTGMFLKRLEQGWTRRVTKKSRKYHGAIGYPIKKSTKTIRIPPRPLKAPVWSTEKHKIAPYVEKKFFKVFFSKKKPGLRF